MTWLLIIGFAIATSIDNLGVGISYGIRNIRIGFLSNLLIAVICFLFSYTGIFFGKWISTILPGVFPMLLGAFFLFIIGLRIILLATPRKNQSTPESTSASTTPRSLQAVLKNPESVDFDLSGEISWIEAIVLGIALSTNALTNGLGAGLWGLTPLAICITASIGSFLTLWWGVSLGKKLATIRIGSFSLGQFGTLISGIILLIIAVSIFL